LANDVGSNSTCPETSSWRGCAVGAGPPIHAGPGWLLSNGHSILAVFVLLYLAPCEPMTTIDPDGTVTITLCDDWLHIAPDDDPYTYTGDWQ
jgi:hypothetical protein